MEIINDRLLRVLNRQPVDRTPIWLMRQAGRYLPEYRELRKSAGSFMNMCKNPELACEITMQPIDRFDLDAAIIFSDILTIPDSLGLGLEFIEGQGPIFTNPITCETDVNKILDLEPISNLNYVADAIKLVKKSLAGKIPLIGFAGSPWTVATYMVEGKSSRNFEIVKKLRFTQPALLHKILTKLANVTVDYLNLQIAAGANLVMLFDTWGGLLAFDDFLEFSLRYMQNIIERIDAPAIIFSKNSGIGLELIAESGCKGVGLDWTVDLANARQRLGDSLAIQGNLDPTALFSSQNELERIVKTTLQRFGAGGHHIFNLGHGILQHTPIENVELLINTVHEYSSQLLQQETVA